jgi:hypothetical protein
MRLAATGLTIEALAVGIAYAQYKFLGRAAVYATCYVWPIHLVIEPLLSAGGLSNKGIVFAVLIVILFWLNSFKWTGLVLLRRAEYRKTAAIPLTMLALSIVLSFSLKGL